MNYQQILDQEILLKKQLHESLETTSILSLRLLQVQRELNFYDSVETKPRKVMGWKLRLLPPKSMSLSNLLATRITWKEEKQWFFGEVVSGPRCPKDVLEGYTLQVRSSKKMDPYSPDYLRFNAVSLKLNLDNYAYEWYILERE